jgi:hypothetical protein
MYSTGTAPSSGNSGTCAEAPEFSFDNFTPVCSGFSEQKISGILDLIAYPHCPERWGLTAGVPLFCVSCEDQIDDTGSFEFSSNPTKKERRIGCAGETVDVVMKEQYMGKFQLSNARHRAHLWAGQSKELPATAGLLRWAMTISSRVGKDPRQDALTIIAKGRETGDPFIVMLSAYPMADQFSVKFGSDDFWRFPVSFSLQSMKVDGFSYDGKSIDLTSAGTIFGLWGELE